MLSSTEPVTNAHSSSLNAGPLRLLQRLAKILSHHTETPENCWFLIWEGYNLTQQTKESASIVVPLARTMHVLGGPRGTDSETFSSETFPAPLWWIPNDQKSCVGNDIYSRSVFIGGTFAAI